MSSKEKSEKKQNSNGHMNGVLITVYVETSTPRSRKLHNPMKADQHYKRKRSSGKQGYECDRRAQLLAYPQQLRNASSQEDECKVQLRTNQSRSKTKVSSFPSLPKTSSEKSSEVDLQKVFEKILVPLAMCAELEALHGSSNLNFASVAEGHMVNSTSSNLLAFIANAPARQ